MDKLYRAFEDNFRGSEEEITERLAKYVPLVKDLITSKNARVLDLGSGRGEWIQLMASLGYDPIGIEISESMASNIKDPKYRIILGDLKTELSKLEDDYFDVITGFHVIEHLTSTELIDLLKEVKSKLRIGGVLLLETPNPSNFFVSGFSFHLDITHLKPVPGPLLKFLVEHTGIGPVEIVPIHGAYASNTNTTIRNVLMEGSKDYVLISIKSKDTNGSSYRLKSSISKHLAVHLAKETDWLALDFDTRLEATFTSLENRISNLEKRDLFALIREKLTKTKRKLK